MKLTRIAAFAALSSTLLLGSLRAADKPVDFDFGTIGASTVGQVVEVNLQSAVLKMVSKLAAVQDPEAADLIKNIDHVKVNVVKVDDSNRAAAQERINAVRSRLDSEGWEKIVTVREEKGDNVAVYMRLKDADTIQGIVVTVMSASGEAVIVNIGGEIRPEQVAKLGQKYNIDPLKKLDLKKSS